MPKELLLIVDKPLVQYSAKEAIAAKIVTLIFVTGRNKRAIEDHFDINPSLEEALVAKGNVAQADMVRTIPPRGVECFFGRQPEQLSLGHPRWISPPLASGSSGSTSALALTGPSACQIPETLP